MSEYNSQESFSMSEYHVQGASQKGHSGLQGWGTKALSGYRVVAGRLEKHLVGETADLGLAG